MAESLSVDEFKGFTPATDDEFSGFKPADEFEGFQPVDAPPISGKLLGSETTPSVGSNEPDELPVLEKTDPLFPRVMGDVEAGQIVVNQFLLPSKVDAFSMLDQAERSGQVAVAEVKARQARERLNKIGADPFNPDYYRAREEEQDLSERAKALNLRFQADTPLGRMKAEEGAAAQREQALREQFEASGEGPGVVGTFLEQIAGMATNVVGGALRTIAPSIGGAVGDDVIREGGRMTELANVNQSLGGQIGRGAGTVAGLLVGNPAGAVPSTIAVGLKGAMDAYSQTLQQTGNASEADRAVMHTFPALALYMATGIAGARAAAGMTPVNAAPATKALAGFTGAGIANVGTTGAVALAEGTDYGIEELTADTLLAIFHAKGEYSRGVSEQARERAKVELFSRGFAEKQIERPFELGENTPAFRVIVEPANKPPPLMDSAAMQAEVTRAINPPVDKGGEPTVAPDAAPQVEPPPESPGQRRLGPGAANIEEFPAQTRVGAYNAAVDTQRAERGLEPLMSKAREADSETWDQTERKVEADPEHPARLVDDLLSGTKTSVDKVEQSELLWRMIDLRGRRTTELERALDPNLTPEEQLAAKTEYDSLEQQLQRTEEADRKAGTSSGETLRIRRLMAYEDFTLAGLMGKARIAKGTDLTATETTDIQQKSKRFEKAKQKFEERQRLAEEEAPVDDAIRAIEAEASKDPEFRPEVRSLADRIISRLDKAATGARERLGALLSQMGSGPDPSIVLKLTKELATIAASDIAKGALTFGRWAAKTVKAFGDKVSPYLKAAWDAANKNIDENVSGVGKNRDKVKEAVAKTKAVATAETIGAGMKERIAAGEKLTDMRGQVQKLVETLVRGGIKQRELLVDAVHEVLKGVDPAITRRQAMDAISGYGDFKPLNKDAVKAEVRDLKGQLQQVGKLEDLESKKPLQKTGVERRTPSDEERRLIQQVNEAKKKFGVVVTDPAIQLKSTLATIETRLTNRIKDLQAEIAAGERAVKTKTDPPSNEKIEALRKELAQVEAEHASTFGKRQMTDEQRLKAAIESAKRVEQSETARLEKAKRGVFDKPLKKPEQRSAELDAIRARTEAAREERIALEKLNNPPLSKAQKQLDAALVARERWQQLLAGEIAPAKKMPQDALSDLEADARAEISAMRELASEIRRDAKPKTDTEAAKETAAVKALEKAAAEYERRVNEMDFSSKGKKQGPDTAKVAQARALRDAAKSAFEAARKLANPPRTKEEIALQTYKARVARQIADLQTRIAADDFATRAKKPPLDLSKDPEAVKAQTEMQRVKGEFQAKQRAWERSQWSAAKRLWEGIKSVADASANLATSLDLSALRQGVKAFTARPLTGLKNIGAMLKSFASETKAREIEAEIRLRPNAKLYKEAGLEITPIDETSFTAAEENMGSRLAEKLPLVRASNRAFKTFLNRMRADTFDAIVGMKGRPLEKAELEAVGNFVNVATGRGNFGRFQGAVPLLGRVYWSPRLLLSQIQYLIAPLNPGSFFHQGGGWTRKVIAKEYGRYLAGTAALFTLAKLAGWEVGDDPTSADFGKVIIGNTRIDPLGGLAQVMTLVGRLAKGESTDGKGRTKEKDAGDVLGKFNRSKLSPFMGTAWDIISGKQYSGEPTTIGTVARNVFVPLSLRDLPDDIKEDGLAQALAMWVSNLFGISARSY